MKARVVYRFSYIAPNAATSLFFHGLGEGFSSFSLRVYAGPGDGVPYPTGRASMRQDEFYRHVNNTMARKIYIQNLAPFNACFADLILLEVPV